MKVAYYTALLMAVSCGKAKVEGEYTERKITEEPKSEPKAEKSDSETSNGKDSPEVAAKEENALMGIYDADGKRVGYPVDLDEDMPKVYLESGQMVLLDSLATGFDTNYVGGGDFYHGCSYESSDCSGECLISDQSYGKAVQPYADSTSLYIATGREITISLGSSFDWRRSQCDHEAGTQIKVKRSKKLNFATPFTLKQ